MDQAFPTFTTNRLIFRQIQPKDVNNVYRLFSDKETMMFDGGRTMTHFNEAFQFITMFSVGYPDVSFIRWVIESKENGEFLGTGGFHKISPEAKRGEIGGELLKNVWGNGIGKEAIFGLTNFAFDHLQFNRITAMISPKNVAAQKVAEKMGFVKEGQLRDWEYWNNAFTDMNIYSLLKREWKGQHI